MLEFLVKKFFGQKPKKNDFPNHGAPKLQFFELLSIIDEAPDLDYV